MKEQGGMKNPNRFSVLPVFMPETIRKRKRHSEKLRCAPPSQPHRHLLRKGDSAAQALRHGRAAVGTRLPRRFDMAFLRQRCRFGSILDIPDAAGAMTQQDSVSENSTDAAGVMIRQDSASEQSPRWRRSGKKSPLLPLWDLRQLPQKQKSKKIRFLREKCNFVLDMMQKRCYNSTHKSKQPYEVFRKTAARLTEGVILSGVRKDRD